MISLHEPRFTAEDERLVLEALRSTWVSTGGPFVDAFEDMFAKFVGTKHAVSVANGTIAIQLALEGLKRQKGVTSNFDVFVPTLSFIATANAVSHAGGNPILLDTSKDSLNVNPSEVEDVIESKYQKTSNGYLNKTSGNILLCIMPAHIMGWTCDMAYLRQIADHFHIPIVEDAAEALGSFNFDGSHVGTSTLAAAFSFNGNKILTTGGGGMLVTNNDQFAALAKHLSTTAKIDNLRYIHDQVGYNYRMVNLLAALGVSQLSRLKEVLLKKEEIFCGYSEMLAEIGVAVHKESNNKCNHWIVNGMFRNESEREQALKKLISCQIHARPLWTPAHKLPFMNSANTLDRVFPNAESVWQRCLSLPSSAHISREEMRRVVNTISEAIKCQPG